MTAMPGALDRSRVRGFALLVALLLGGAIWSLWPASRHGLVIYAAGEGAAPIARAFTAETGIPVIVIRLFTGPMLARIAAEGRRPGWSIAWIDSDMPAASLDRAGLLEHDVIPAAEWTPLGRALLPADGAWIPTGVTLSGVMLQRRGSGEGRLGMPDPALSGPAYPQLAGMAWANGGWPAAQAGMLRLKAAGLQVAPTSPAVVAELDAGRIGRALVQSSTAYMLAAHRPEFRVVVPRPSFLMPGVLMVAKGLPPETRVKVSRFAAFVLSRHAQQLRLASGTVDSFYWPITRDAPLVTTMPALDTLGATHLDPYAWAPLQADITSWFETEVTGR